MLTLLMRLTAFAVCAWAGVGLLVLKEPATRAARAFLAVGWLAWAAYFIVISIVHPIAAGGNTALAFSAVARGLAVWTAVGTVVIVKQRHRVGVV